MQFNVGHVFSWSDCEQIIQSEAFELFKRTPAQLEDYRRWTMSTLDRYASTDDYIKHVVLGWDVKQEAVDTSRSTNGLLNLFNVNPQDDVATSNSAQQMAFRLVAYRRVESQSLLQQDRLQVILKFNDFPYKFEAGILHYCLWSNQDLSRNFIVEYISEAFDCRVYDMLWFMNPPHKKTIKNVWHVHILLRKRSNDD